MIVRSQGAVRGLVSLALLTALTGAKGFTAAPLGNVILASSTLPIGKSVIVRPGDTVFRQDVVRGGVAYLLSPLPLAIADKARTLTPEDSLEEMAIIRGPADFTAAAHMFCATPNVMEGAAAASKAVIGAMAFGLLGGLQRTQLVNRFCLIDKDGDGIAEAAILAGAKRAADAAPIRIDPSPLKIQRNFLGKLPSEVQLTYLGPAGLTGESIAFEIKYVASGEQVRTGSPRASASRMRLPRTLSIDGGAQVTVLSFDPTTKAATVQIDKPFETGTVHFAPVPVYVYVPTG